MIRLVMFFWLTLALQAAATPVSYTLQAERSDVGFVYNVGGADARGSMPVAAAQIAIDFDDFNQSRVDVTLDASRARAGLITATEALKGPSVLDVANHPMIRFEATAVRASDPRNLSQGGQIDGLLTVRGITRPVTLHVAVFRQRGTAEGDLRALSFQISGAISRSAFGAVGYAGLVDDLITVDIIARVRRAE